MSKSGGVLKMDKPKLFTVYLCGDGNRVLNFLAFDEVEAEKMAYDWISQNNYNGDIDGIKEHDVDLFEEDL